MIGIIAERIRKFLFSFFENILSETKEFFKKPSALVSLLSVSLSILDPLLQQVRNKISAKISATLNKNKDPNLVNLDPNNLSSRDINNYFKRNRNLQKVINFVGNDVDEDIIGDIIKACENPEYYPKQHDKLRSRLKGKNLKGNDFINIVQQENDFEQKVSSYRIGNSLRGLLTNIDSIIYWTIITFIIVEKVKEFLIQNEFPSRWRGKYLQRLIRVNAALLRHSIQNEKDAAKKAPDTVKQIYKNTINEVEDLINILKRVDTLIAASLLASFIYQQNRKEYSRASFESFSESVKGITCTDIESPIDIIVAPPKEIIENDFSRFDCPIDIDETIIPSKPLDELMTGLKCDLDAEEIDDAIEEKSTYDLATKAIFKNESEKPFSILVNEDDFIDTKTVIATLGDINIYSPVNGIIEKTNEEKDEIFITDLIEPEKTFLEKLIESVQNKYQVLNESKFFIGDFFIESVYPIMLLNSPVVDASLSIPDRNVIKYFTGGVEKRWDIAKRAKKFNKDRYEKSIKNITKEDIVKKRAKDEELHKIKEDLDSVEKIYFEKLNGINKLLLNQTRATLPEKEEFALLDYYIDLMQHILTKSNNYKDSKIFKKFRDELNNIIINRYFIDEWSLEKFIKKLNSVCNELAQGTFFEESPNFFQIMYRLYINSNKDKKAVINWLKFLGDKNDEFTEEEKEEVIERIMFIFDLVIIIIQKTEQEYSVEDNHYEALIKEVYFINNFFKTLWKKYEELPKEIEDINETLNELSEVYIPYSIQTINDEDYRYYGIGKERDCPIPTEEDENLSPYSEYSYGDIEYWLKYCSMATLIGATNYPRGWGTGFPPPLGPTPFPIVYIPFNAFQLPWGFIVVGLTITGIYPFPWAAFVNYDTNHHVPLADPAERIKREIRELKKTLSFNLKEYKQKTLKNYLETKKKEINSLTEKIDNYSKLKREHRLEKPQRDRSKEARTDIPRYTKELADWVTKQAEYTEIITTTKTRKWRQELKYRVAYNAINDIEPIKNTEDPKLKSFEETEKAIDKKFESLDTLFASINNLLAPLPISTKPMSANFAFTIKNPQPIINFAENLDENINEQPLNSLINQFKLNNEDFMSSEFTNKVQNSIVNFNDYKKALIGIMPAVIVKDPFPKYENLKLTNLPWVSFLYSNWSIAGGKTYGIPGFP